MTAFAVIYDLAEVMSGVFAEVLLIGEVCIFSCRRLFSDTKKSLKCSLLQ